MSKSVLKDGAFLLELDKSTESARCLPTATYTEDQFLVREYRNLFDASWVSVGFAQQVPRAGDVLPVLAGGQALVVTRDQYGAVRVFHNVCRHRGLELVDGPKHCPNGLMTCAYHRWSYALDGSLKQTPYWDGTAASQPDAATRRELGLLPVRSAVWCDIIFVNLSGDAPAFDTFIEPLARRWEAFDLSLLRFLETQHYPVPANWKFVCENFLDSYHLPWVHPALGEPATAYITEATHLSEDIFGFLMPAFGAGLDPAEPALPVFPNLPTPFDIGLDLVYVFPNTLLLMNAGWLQAITFQAEGPAATSEVLAAYLVGDAALSEDCAHLREEFVELLRMINGQDVEILARMQKGRRGTASDDGRFAPHWDQLAHQFFKRVARAYIDEEAH